MKDREKDIERHSLCSTHARIQVITILHYKTRAGMDITLFFHQSLAIRAIS